MDRKVLLQDLADGLVRRRGLAKKDAEQFVRAVFDIVSQYLETDKLVKIKGLGTFKVIQVSSRESVNVNTGERIRINGHAKVTFVPDAVLKDEVNKPFVHFETVVINDSTSLDDMERMDFVEDLEEGDGDCGDEVADDCMPEEGNEVSDRLEEVSESTPEESASAGEDVELAERIADEKTTGSEELESQDAQEKPETQEENDVPVHDLSQEPEESVVEAKDIVEESAGEDCPPASSSPGVAEEDADEVAATSPQVVPASVEHLQAEYQRVEHQKVEDLSVASQRVEHQTIENQHIVQQERELSERKGMRITPWGMVGLLLLVLALMLGSYYAGYYGLLCPTCAYEEVVRPKTETAVGRKAAAVRSAAQEVKRDTVASMADGGSKDESASCGETANKDTVRQAAGTETKAALKASSPSGRKDTVKAGGGITVSSGYAQVPGGKYRITGTRKTTVIQSGQTLRGIALEEYGSKGYASYIIVHNGIKDPDRVEAGKILKLPELEMREQ